jgi:hypothetical protein
LLFGVVVVRGAVGLVAVGWVAVGWVAVGRLVATVRVGAADGVSDGAYVGL